MKSVNKQQLLPIFLISLFLVRTVYALDDSQQLQLERAGRLMASTFMTGNPDEKLYGLHPDYYPARPREMIHPSVNIEVHTEHAIQETKVKVQTLNGLSQFEKWVVDVRKNFRMKDNLEVRTMGVCVDGCCHYPVDGGMSHNTLYLSKACFVFKNKRPFLSRVTLLDGD